MRKNYLDVLKAFAIIAVVLYHSGLLTDGYLGGVEVFFVINGYLITRSLNSKILVNNKLNIGGYFQFEFGRIVRLLPLLLVAGLVCMLLGLFFMLPDDYENLSASVIATNLFGNNILQAITTKNYWDVVNDYKPLMHTWYVGMIMQFYLVYPLLFFFAKLDKKNPQRALLAIISTMAVVSLLIYWGTTNAAHRFYYLPARFFEFAAGGIVALSWKPDEGNKPFHTWFVYLCYAFLMVLFFVPIDILPANIKLITLVALTVVLIMSSSALENKVTGNGVLAKIGAASYSIYVWHQVLLAFYRYTISSHFTVVTYTIFLAVVALLSFLTYKFIEQKINGWLKERRSKSVFYVVTGAVFLCLTGFAGWIYLKGGVVRDVPELYITKNEKVDHGAYNEKIHKLNAPFKTDKPHWLVVGNSFGRDFANVILESSVSDSVEVSYINIANYSNPEYAERFASADRVWLSTGNLSEEVIYQMEVVCERNGFPIDHLVIVSKKDFGENNGQFYANRDKAYYFEQRAKVGESFIVENNSFKSQFGDRYLDLMSLVLDENGTVPVFTPDHHYISQDCRHFSKGGAVYFSELIDWNRYLQ